MDYGCCTPESRLAVFVPTRDRARELRPCLAAEAVGATFAGRRRRRSAARG